MDGAEMLSWLRAQPHVNAVDVVAKLLGVCHASLGELRARWNDRRYARAAEAVTADVERLLVGQNLAQFPQVVTLVANMGPTSAVVARPSRRKPIFQATCAAGCVIEVSLANGDDREL